MGTIMADVSTEQEVRVVAAEALTTVQRATSILVRDIQSRTQAAEIGRAIASLDKQAKEKFDLIKKPIHQAHKAACDWENEVRQPLENAKRYLSTQIGAFDQAQEVIRRAEEARLQEEARVQAQAEADRQSREQALQDAIALEAAGDSKGAEAVLNNPTPVEAYVPPVILPTLVPKAAGVSSAKTWKFRITDVDKIPREYMVPNETMIGQMVRAMKEKTSIPGVEAYPENGARFRA